MTSAARQLVCSSAGRLGRVVALTLSLLVYSMLASAGFAGDSSNVQEQQEEISATAAREVRTRSDLAGVSHIEDTASPRRQQSGRSLAAAGLADAIMSRPSVGSSLPLRL
jgi:hypothetical protein